MKQQHRSHNALHRPRAPVTSGLSSQRQARHNRDSPTRSSPMRRLPLTLLAAGLLASGIATAATTTIPAAAVKTAEQLRDQALHDDTAYQVTASLTTEVGARLAGSEADRRAVDWAVAKFKELGYDKVYTEPVTYPLWVRRSEHAAIVAPFPQPLALTE